VQVCTLLVAHIHTVFSNIHQHVAKPECEAGVLFHTNISLHESNIIFCKRVSIKGIIYL